MAIEGITFYNYSEAREYAKRVDTEGHEARITHPKANTWRVLITTKTKRRTFKPSIKATKETLDVGAGKYPVSRVTRAVDITIPDPTVKVERKSSTLKEYKQADVTKGIPYGDKSFDKVISRWALGVKILGRKAYKELARVLKPKGKVEVRVLKDDKKYMDEIVKNLQGVGITIDRIDEHTYKGKKKDTVEYVIHGAKQ